jgi:L-alanine-DL-glutamate epimerase-like enolase superfamily enzyme
MRLADGKEVLVVRVLTREGVAGIGFTFTENVAAARAMARWDAAAKSAALPLWRLLRERHPDAIAQFDDHATTVRHPWCDAWRAELDAARDNMAPQPRSSTPGIGIDWTLEPGFATLRWIEPEPKKEERHGRTAD